MSHFFGQKKIMETITQNLSYQIPLWNVLALFTGCGITIHSKTVSYYIFFSI